MGGAGGSGGSEPDPRLSGTTLRIYRLLYREGRPMGVNEIQRVAGLSSPSVAYYHMRKLVSFGLIHETEGGYVVDKILFENMIRIRRSLIPLHITFVVFFGITLVALLTVLRPAQVTSLYALATIINLSSLGIFLFESIQTLRNSRA